MRSDQGDLVRITVLIRAALWGFLVGELLILSSAIGGSIANFFQNSTLALISLCVSALILCGYLAVRRFFRWVWQRCKSLRFDVWTMAALGGVVSYVSRDIGHVYYVTLVGKLTPEGWLTLVAVPVAAFSFVVFWHVRGAIQDRCRILTESAASGNWRWLAKFCQHNSETRFFISDTEITDCASDLLGTADRARNFAERVLNEGSSESVVFAIDGPWGVGKSSFVNFCIEYWNSNSAGAPVIFQFKPLRYESKKKILEKFIDGLVDAVRNDTFVPELSPALSRYSRLVRAKDGLSIGGFNLELPFFSRSVENAYGDLQDALKRAKRKLIVVVDDLDRLPLKQVKNILFTIKAGFSLPYVSYVLCYDTENITYRVAKSDDIREFLEKFVNSSSRRAIFIRGF